MADKFSEYITSIFQTEQHGQLTNVVQEEIVGHLLKLSDNELIEVMQRFFSLRPPYPGEIAFDRSHFFLGLATSMLEDHSNISDEKVEWTNWSIHAVSYVDRSIYLGDTPDEEFGQYGICSVCGTQALSHVKHALCSICGSSVHLT